MEGEWDNSENHTKNEVTSQSFSGSQCNFKLFFTSNLKLIDKPG